MIKIIAGRASYGKTKKVLDKLKENHKKSISSYLMVPEQFTLQSELNLMEHIDTDSLMDIKVMSFERLAKEVLSRHGGIKRPYIDEIGKHMALRAIFDKYKEEIILYQGAFKREGFLEELSHTLSEMKKMNIDPTLLMGKSEIIQDNKLLSQKIYEVGFIYQRFIEYMDGRYVDNDDRIGLLAEKVELAKELSDIEFYFDSFTGFTSLELNVIEKLNLLGANLTFALTLDMSNPKDKEVFSPTEGTLTQLMEIAKRADEKIEIMSVEQVSKKPFAIDYIEKNLFIQRPASSEKEAAGAKIYKALTAESEVQRCAHEIVGLVRDEGFRYKDIAVLMSMPEIYSSKINRIFTEYEIPHFIDIKRDIMASPLINMIFSFLDMGIRNLRYEDVFGFLKSDFTDIKRENYLKLENFVLKWGIKGKMWSDDHRFEEEKFFDKEDEKEQIKEARDYILEINEKFKKKFKRKDTALSYAKHLFSFLEDIKAQEKIESFVEVLKEEQMLDHANESAQIWNVLLETLDQFVEILGEEKITLGEFRTILYEGLKRHEIGVIPPASDQVLTVTLDRSRSAGIKALFFLGFNDTYVPRVSKDSPILLDEDKERLKDLGVNLPSERENRLKEESLGIYSAVSKPSEYLYLSYSLADEEGKALRPSTVLEKIIKILPNIKIESELASLNPMEAVDRKEPTFRHIGQALRDYVEDGEIDEKYLSIYGYFHENQEYFEARNMLIDSLFYTNKVENIGKDYAKKLYDAPFKASVTRLEKFAKCPYDHFIEYGLRPKERKIHEISPLELGSIFHNSIEKFAQKANELKNLPQLIDREYCNKVMDSIVEESISHNVKILMESSKRNAYVMKKIKKISQRAAWTMINHITKGRFEMVAQELEIPDIVINLGEDEITLTGRIDRVDILEDDEESFVKIVDYKSRKKSFSLEDAYYGLDIQLVVYMDALLENPQIFKKTELHPAGVFYFPIMDTLIKTESESPEEVERLIEKELRMQGIVLKDIRVARGIEAEIEGDSTVAGIKVKDSEVVGENALTEQEFGILIDHVMTMVKDMSKEILNGNISIEPYAKKGGTPCQYCKYSSVCKFDEKLDGNNHKNLKNLNDKQIKEILFKGGENDAVD